MREENISKYINYSLSWVNRTTIYVTLHFKLQISPLFSILIHCARPEYIEDHSISIFQHCPFGLEYLLGEIKKIHH